MSTTITFAASPISFSSRSTHVERVVARRHEDVAHHLHDRHVHAGRGLPDHASLAGIGLRIIRRPDHVLVVIVVVDEILLVPDVIARGVGVDRELRQLLHDRLGDAESAGGVLDVDDREVDLLAIDDMIRASDAAPSGQAGRRRHRCRGC